jgi:hypothetical protein
MRAVGCWLRPERGSAVPITGTRAATPGIAVNSSKRIVAARIRSSPHATAVPRAHGGRRRRATITATRPPMANSQARAGVA